METTNRRIQIARITFLVLAIIFSLCISIQFFLAGMSILISPSYWMEHLTFVHLFGFNIPIFMLVFAFIGAFPIWAYLQLFGVLIFIFLMYFSANITATFPWFGAIHPVIGILLFVLSCSIILKTWEFTFIYKNSQKGVK